MRYYWDLIIHFLTANSRHGTHSPYVYKLADEVIYQKSLDSLHRVAVTTEINPKTAAVLLAILDFMEVPVVDKYPSVLGTGALLIDLQTMDKLVIEQLVGQGYILIVEEPYGSSKTKAAWLSLQQSTQLTVCLDLFHFGILMHRDGQRKEYFRLRYPYGT